MENNRTSEVLGSSSMSLPSGLEVESARLHMPTEGGQHTSGLTHSSWREKLDTMKNRSMETLNSARGSVATRISSVKPAARRQISRVQTNLRSHPGTWTGAAVGAGFAVGLMGRLLLDRSQRRSMPEVIVISGAC